MPKLVQVMAEQAQISEEDTTKACDPNFDDCNPEEVASKARDPDFDDQDPEEIAKKSCNLDFVYC
ncbi:hypothetical protein TIFTF001_019335 [Ficus carica]|uniref:Uncharacterized protein n=1 Tax=Ficus carica TaxID=3494 RepID=A0AA88ABH5_FICCA|nr:hypothetical protein TIFTF001_019335 [Ficus carica]